MIKVIKDPEFIIDISNIEFTIVEKCNWFTSDTFYDFSLPIKIPYCIHSFFNKYKSYNSEELEMDFNVVLDLHGELHNAEMSINDLESEFVSLLIKWGFKTISSYRKNLQDLSLEQRTVTNIREHAKNVLTKNYPETNYNFISVYFPFYDKGSKVWSKYSNFINLYKEGDFAVNSMDAENNQVYNRTLIQPQPHLLHVLMKGFEDAGYTLKGDVLNDEQLKNAYIFSSKKLIIPELPGAIKYIVGEIDRENTNNFLFKRWIYNQEILPYGKFKVTGWLRNNHGYKYFYLNDELVYNYSSNFDSTVNFNFEITTTQGADNFKFYGFGFNMDGDVAEITITPIEVYDENGNIIQYVADSNVINLKNNVPDMKFETLVEIIRKLCNFDITPVGKDIYMNYIQEEFKNREAIDLSSYEVKEPSRKPLRLNKWLLKYKEVNSNEYNLDSYFISKNGVEINAEKQEEDTQKIEIDLIPLKLGYKENMNAPGSYQFGSICPVEDNSKLMLVLYNNSDVNKNQGLDNTPLLIPAIYDKHYFYFLNFRIKAIEFRWLFSELRNKLNKLRKGSKVYAYNREHIVKEIATTNISPDVNEYEITTES